MFSAVRRASSPVFIFFAPGFIFDGTEGVVSYFAFPDSFSAVSGSLGPVFLFCAPVLVFGGSEGVGSRSHVLRAQIHFRRYRGRRVPFSCVALVDLFTAVLRESCLFSCFVLSDSFSAVPSASGPVFMLLSWTRLRRYRWRRFPFSRFALLDSFSLAPSATGPVFTFCALGLIFSCTGGVGSHFLVLRAQTRFRRYPGRPF
jgi:hypothetical protein